ncbi:helix-turn-helix domain-containing protein [Novosphingobium sp. PC22D]|uniref:helix-turn-helix domain-containing protein n=1 Tax=Novosphingobium sp. PC22D TaxID=1962403 RepID=UPI001F0A45F5|nr:helix-turn-helix domain-containing protein [Novosphingobium sp. PC22D]
MQTRDGQPLSYNRAPAADLAPWIARIYVIKFDVKPGHVLRCGLLNDTAFVRIMFSGQAQAETIDGEIAFGRSALFFGPQSRRMKYSMRGNVAGVGIAIRPGACTSLKGPRLGDYLDRIAPVEIVSPDDKAVIDTFAPDAAPEDWCRRIESLFRIRTEKMGWPVPDPVTASFEGLTLSNPAISVKQAAAECGVDLRKLERIIKRDFGLPPKQVLRRARALDMASYLRGVADGAESEELSLRYYDDSHFLREFAELFGMSPRQFTETPQPLMTLALELRQARRLEFLKRLEPGKPRPWQ